MLGAIEINITLECNETDANSDIFSLSLLILPWMGWCKLQHEAQYTAARLKYHHSYRHWFKVELETNRTSTMWEWIEPYHITSPSLQIKQIQWGKNITDSKGVGFVELAEMLQHMYIMNWEACSLLRRNQHTRSTCVYVHVSVQMCVYVLRYHTIPQPTTNKSQQPRKSSVVGGRGASRRFIWRIKGVCVCVCGSSTCTGPGVFSGHSIRSRLSSPSFHAIIFVSCLLLLLSSFLFLSPLESPVSFSVSTRETDWQLNPPSLDSAT